MIKLPKLSKIMAIMLSKLTAKKEDFFSFLTLFTSLSTILCCALPIILVMLGMGAVFASLTANFPFIIWIAQQALYLFLIAGLLMAISGYFIFLRPQSCPADAKLAAICTKSKKFNKIIWWISLVILLVAFFFKYLLIFFSNFI